MTISKNQIKSDANNNSYKSGVSPEMNPNMKFVPYTFVDAVAHLISKEDVEVFLALSNNLWSSVAQKHERRIDLELDVVLTDDGLTLKAEEAEGIGRFLDGPYCRYARITECYLDDQRTSDTVVDPKMLKKFYTIASRTPILGLDLVYQYNAEASVKNIAFWWKLPVKKLTVSVGSSTEIIKYHFFENELLEQVEVWSAVFCYDFVKQLVESFRKGEMQKMHSTDKK